ncbi:hypothetical protein [Streptomyces mirabilis]|uniref:hypothetical protein n=1 Tax=Streptomyces mirabilis TaxID=68239 RepID=UPI0036C09CF1
MSDLTPDDKVPGLHVSAPPVYRRHDDPARWSTTPSERPSGSYTCGGCGKSDTASGAGNVRALVDDYTANHGTAHKRTGR